MEPLLKHMITRKPLGYLSGILMPAAVLYGCSSSAARPEERQDAGTHFISGFIILK